VRGIGCGQSSRYDYVAEKKDVLAGDATVPFLHNAFHFPLRLLRLDRLALVIELLAFARPISALALPRTK